MTSFLFNTEAEAQAFALGIQHVNDSSLRARVHPIAAAEGPGTAVVLRDLGDTADGDDHVIVDKRTPVDRPRPSSPGPVHHGSLRVVPIDIDKVRCAECHSIAITTEFRIALATKDGGETWTIASDFQPIEPRGKSICDVCEWTAFTDDFRIDSADIGIDKDA